jgi:4-hydroxybenzoate polyprenyltransferase
MFVPIPLEVGHAETIAHAYTRLIAIMFFVGYTVHVLVQIDDLVRDKTNGATSRVRVFKMNSIRIIGRLWWNFIIFGIIWRYPSLIPTGIGLLGVNVSPNVAAVLTLPMNVWFAGGWGYGLDSLLSYIPKLRNVVPPPIS